MQNFLSETQEMVREGRHREALERFIWFHDHALEHEPAMYGVRLSFALSSWEALGAVYPPAKTSLLEIRNRKEQMLMEGKGSFGLFHDVVAFNEVLGENEKTVTLFDWIGKQEPDSAKQYWSLAKNAVIRAKRYDLAREYFGNLTQEFVKIKAMHELNTTLYDDPQAGGDLFKAYNERHLVEESLQLIDVALALDDREVAKEIQAKALAVVDDYRLRDAIA